MGSPSTNVAVALAVRRLPCAAAAGAVACADVAACAGQTAKTEPRARPAPAARMATAIVLMFFIVRLSFHPECSDTKHGPSEPMSRLGVSVRSDNLFFTCGYPPRVRWCPSASSFRMSQRFGDMGERSRTPPKSSWLAYALAYLPPRGIAELRDAARKIAVALIEAADEIAMQQIP
jgi:hypothetical protein